MPWEISVLLAGAALLAFAALAAATLAEIRRTARGAAELAATLARHVPAIRRNLDEIGHGVTALGESLKAFTSSAAGTGRGIEALAGEIRELERDVQQGLVEPLQRAAAGLSALLALGAALRRLRHPFRRRRGKGRA